MADNIYDDIKKRIDLVEVIREDYPLKGHGSEYRGDRDGIHGLVVTRSSKGGDWYYYWNKHNRGGSVIDYLINERGMDMKSAVEWAAKRAGLTLPEWTHQETKSWLRVRATEDLFDVAIKIFERWMAAATPAMDVCRERGWTDETIKSARLGFSGNATAAEYKEMREYIAMNNIDIESPAAVAILGFKERKTGDLARLKDKWATDFDVKDAISNDDINAGYISGFMSKPRLIYPHLYFGKVTYLSSRNLKWEGEKLINEPDKHRKSYNPRRGLIGERKPYFAWNYNVNASHIVIVEGQADVVTGAQWGFNIMGKVGAKLSDYWGAELCKRHETRYDWHDMDEVGENSWRVGKTKVGNQEKEVEYPIADLLGPLTHIVGAPATREGQIKDMNDLRQYYVSKGISDTSQYERVRIRLNNAPVVAMIALKEAAEKQKRKDISLEEKLGSMTRAFEIVARMGKQKANHMLADFVKVTGISVSAFNKGLKDALGERDTKTTDESKPEKTEFIFGGWFPVDEGSEKGWLLDYLWNPETKKAMLAYRDPEGRIGKDWHVDIKGTRYYPKVDANVITGVVVFASDLGVEKNTKELLKFNEDYARSAILLENPLDYKTSAYWPQFTWLYDCFDELCYFRAQGESDSGKSAIVSRMGHLCYRLTKSSGAGSSASLKHNTHVYRGTVLLNEVKDDLPEYDDRVVLLNIGAMKEDAWVSNVASFKNADGTVEHEVINYHVYGPKIATMYGKFPQEATENRFLTVKTIKYEINDLKKNNIPRRFTDELRARAAFKRNLDMTWRLRNWRPRMVPPDELEVSGVSTRLNQVAVPIIHILTLDTTPENQDANKKTIDEFKNVLRASYEEQKSESLKKTEARVIEALDAVENDPAFKLLDFVQSTELDEWGTVTYIRYSDLTKVVNYIIDEMNLGTGKAPIDAIKKLEEEDEGGEKKKKGKKKYENTGVTASTIGVKCKAMRIPTHRLGRGFVVLLSSGAHPEEVQDRIKVLKTRYGVDQLVYDTPTGEIKTIAQREAEKAAKNTPTQAVLPAKDNLSDFYEDENGVMWRKEEDK